MNAPVRNAVKESGGCIKKCIAVIQSGGCWILFLRSVEGMSKIIREYVSCENGLMKMQVVAFVGSVENGREGVSFVIGDRRVALTGKQVKDLIETLVKRINFRPGYCATDWGVYEKVYPDGCSEKAGED